MVRTPSTMLPLGSAAPPFSLPDAGGEIHSLAELAGEKGTLVMFICNHCPFVHHVRPELARLGRELPERGVAVVAINANDVESYPDDAPEKMAQEAQEHGYAFPYLHDDSQAVAQAYRAACTPDFFLFDGNLELVYRGQLDGSRPGNDLPVSGADLRRAVDALLAGNAALEPQLPSLGCNIKWKPGNEPEYF